MTQETISFKHTVIARCAQYDPVSKERLISVLKDVSDTEQFKVQRLNQIDLQTSLRELFTIAEIEITMEELDYWVEYLDWLLL